MRKIIICIILIIVVLTGIFFNSQKLLYNKYATEYSKVFGSYDITFVDEYLDGETIIIYRDFSKEYKELRSSVIDAFSEKRYVMKNNSSYGSVYFNDGVKIIGIQSYVIIDGKSVEVYVEMQLERTGFTTFRVKSISSNHKFFGYLFGLEQ